MRLFAPTMMTLEKRASHSNHGWSAHRRGMIPTRSGITIDEPMAMRLSAVVCATRIISETIASLPLNVMRRVDDRTSEKVTDHPLSRVLHDEPNDEQDAFTWFDQQTPWMLNRGDAMAAIGRRGNERVDLWPLDPYRVKIVRNPMKGLPEVGDPGEIVYEVTYDDGMMEKIARRNMLHVPGVLSEDGLRGRGLIRVGAESMGIATAVEEHTGAFFRNGAAPDFLMTTETPLNKEQREALRSSWEEKQAGVKNHHRMAIISGKALRLEAAGVSAKDAQLLAVREFGVTEISRLYRVPPHMLSDLSRATFSNIEEQSLSFVKYTMLPWVRRWEQGMCRQLLTDQEKEEGLFIKFNMQGLLRGDSAARAAFYNTLFNMGALSVNEIRGWEDLNPVDGGDEHFFAANNLAPMNEPQNETPVDDEESTERAKQLKAAMSECVESTERPTQVAVTDDIQSRANHAAAIATIERTISDLMHSERRNVDAAAKKPGKFIEWSDQFYSEFATTFERAMVPVCKMVATYGLDVDPSDIATTYCSASRAGLDSCLSAKVSEFPDAVTETLILWNDRPREMAEQLMKGA